MNAANEAAAEAVDDVRALMEAFLKSGFRELHVVSADTEVFLALDGAGPNPMRGAATPSVGATAPAASEVGAKQTEIRAPHVATIISVAAEGVMVRSGEPLARMAVLDDEEDLLARASGKVGKVAAQAGELVEYGSLLLTIEEAI